MLNEIRNLSVKHQDMRIEVVTDTDDFEHIQNLAGSPTRRFFLRKLGEHISTLDENQLTMANPDLIILDLDTKDNVELTLNLVMVGCAVLTYSTADKSVYSAKACRII